MLDLVLLFVRYTVHAVTLFDLCPRNVTVVEMTYTRRGSKWEITVTSAYLPYDSNEPLPSNKLR